MRPLRIAGVVAAAAALAGSWASTASAAAPQAVVIESTVTEFTPDFEGTWQSSGVIADSGSFTEPFVRFTGSTLHSPVVQAFQAVLVFTGTQGTITVRQQVTFTAEASNGVWEVLSGSGAYQGVTGQGTFEFVFPNSLTFTGVMNLSRAP
jgi:hypothetical protein